MKVRLFSQGELPATHKPLCHKSELYVDSLVHTGEAIKLSPSEAQLTGWKRMRSDDIFTAQLKRIAGSGFNSAWAINQSGPTGPLVWQMNT